MVLVNLQLNVKKGLEDDFIAELNVLLTETRAYEGCHAVYFIRIWTILAIWNFSVNGTPGSITISICSGESKVVLWKMCQNATSMEIRYGDTLIWSLNFNPNPSLDRPDRQRI